MIAKNHQFPANEKLLPLADAVEAVYGYRPHLTTCLRWVQRGFKKNELERIILESTRTPGKRLTSVEAVKRFRDALMNATTNPPSPKLPVESARSEAARQKQIKRADKALEAAGI